jgi:hypothetical protein
MNDLKNHKIDGMFQKVQGKFNTLKSSRVQFLSLTPSPKRDT